MTKLEKISNNIDRLNRRVGRCTSWLALTMVLLMFFNVVSRYAFGLNLIWQQELAGFMHAILFLLAGGYTLLDDKHVRVDVLYNNFSEKKQALVNLLGTIFLLFPVCFALSYFAFDFIISSWKIHEASREYNGMPGIYLLKTCIWLFTFFLSLQGVSTICKSLITLRGDR